MNSHVLSLSPPSSFSSLDRLLLLPSFFVCLNPSFERDSTREENTYFSRPCQIDYSFLYSVNERRHLFLYQVLQEIAKSLQSFTLNQISIQSRKVFGRSLYHRVLYGKGWINGGGVREGETRNTDELRKKKKINDAKETKMRNKNNNSIGRRKEAKERKEEEERENEMKRRKKKEGSSSSSSPWYLLRFSTFPPWLSLPVSNRSSFDRLSSSSSSSVLSGEDKTSREEDLSSSYRKSLSLWGEEQKGKKEEDKEGAVRTLWLYGAFAFSPLQSKYLSGEISSSSSFSVEDVKNRFSSSSVSPLSVETAKRTSWFERLQKSIQAASDRQEGKVRMFYSLNLKDISLLSDDEEDSETAEEEKSFSLLSASLSLLSRREKEKSLSMTDILQRTFCSCYCSKKMLKFFSAIPPGGGEDDDEDEEDGDDADTGGKEKKRKRRKKESRFFGFLSERIFRLFKTFLSYL